jgi:hypothetical protein
MGVITKLGSSTLWSRWIPTGISLCIGGEAEAVDSLLFEGAECFDPSRLGGGCGIVAALERESDRMNGFRVVPGDGGSAIAVDGPAAGREDGAK